MKESNSYVVVQYAILNNLLACDDRLASDLLRYYSSRRTPVEFLIAPAIGNGRPKLDFNLQHVSLVSHVVEVEWAKFTRFSPR